MCWKKTKQSLEFIAPINKRGSSWERSFIAVAMTRVRRLSEKSNSNALSWVC